MPDYGKPIDNNLHWKSTLDFFKEDEQKLNAMDCPPKENEDSQALVADGDSKRPKSEVGTNEEMFKKEEEVIENAFRLPWTKKEPNVKWGDRPEPTVIEDPDQGERKPSRIDRNPPRREEPRGLSFQHSLENTLLKLMKGEEIEKRDSSGQYKRPRQAERKFPSPSEIRERAVKIGDPTKIKIPTPEETSSEDLEKVKVPGVDTIRRFGTGLMPDRFEEGRDKYFNEHRGAKPRYRAERIGRAIRNFPMRVADRSASELNPEVAEDALRVGVTRPAGEFKEGFKEGHDMRYDTDIEPPIGEKVGRVGPQTGPAQVGERMGYGLGRATTMPGRAGRATRDFFQPQPPEGYDFQEDMPPLMDAHQRQALRGREASEKIASDRPAGKSPFEMSVEKALLKLMKADEWEEPDLTGHDDDAMDKYLQHSEQGGKHHPYQHIKAINRMANGKYQIHPVGHGEDEMPDADDMDINEFHGRYLDPEGMGVDISFGEGKQSVSQLAGGNTPGLGRLNPTQDSAIDNWENSWSHMDDSVNQLMNHHGLGLKAPKAPKSDVEKSLLKLMKEDDPSPEDAKDIYRQRQINRRMAPDEHPARESWRVQNLPPGSKPSEPKDDGWEEEGTLTSYAPSREDAAIKTNRPLKVKRIPSPIEGESKEDWMKRVFPPTEDEDYLDSMEQSLLKLMKADEPFIGPLPPNPAESDPKIMEANQSRQQRGIPPIQFAPDNKGGWAQQYEPLKEQPQMQPPQHGPGSAPRGIGTRMRDMAQNAMYAAGLKNPAVQPVEERARVGRMEERSNLGGINRTKKVRVAGQVNPSGGISYPGDRDFKSVEKALLKLMKVSSLPDDFDDEREKYEGDHDVVNYGQPLSGQEAMRRLTEHGSTEESGDVPHNVTFPHYEHPGSGKPDWEYIKAIHDAQRKAREQVVSDNEEYKHPDEGFHVNSITKAPSGVPTPTEKPAQYKVRTGTPFGVQGFTQEELDELERDDVHAGKSKGEYPQDPDTVHAPTNASTVLGELQEAKKRGIEQSLLKLIKQGDITPAKVGMSRRNAMRDIENAWPKAAPQVPKGVGANTNTAPMPTAPELEARRPDSDQAGQTANWSAQMFAGDLAGKINRRFGTGKQDYIADKKQRAEWDADFSQQYPQFSQNGSSSNSSLPKGDSTSQGFGDSRIEQQQQFQQQTGVMGNMGKPIYSSTKK